MHQMILKFLKHFDQNFVHYLSISIRVEILWTSLLIRILEILELLSEYWRKVWRISIKLYDPTLLNYLSIWSEFLKSYEKIEDWWKFDQNFGNLLHFDIGYLAFIFFCNFFWNVLKFSNQPIFFSVKVKNSAEWQKMQWMQEMKAHFETALFWIFAAKRQSNKPHFEPTFLISELKGKKSRAEPSLLGITLNC